jgi:ABC-type multidrug transport system fused ATPase/permease subunit
MQGKFSIYRRLFAYLRPYPRAVALAYGGMLAATLLNLAVPQLLRVAIDQGLADGNPTALFWAGGLILAIALVRAGAGYLQRFYGEWLTHRVAYDLRNDFYQAVQQLPFAFHDRAHTGDLMSRATGDISETERFVGIGLMELVAVAALGGGVIVAMFAMNAQLALLTLPSILLLIYLALRFGRSVKPQFQVIQQQMGVVSTIMQESLTGINLVKAFAREEHEFAKFDAENEDWLRRRVAVIRTWGAYWPSFTLILAGGVFLLLWVGGPWAMEGVITAGTLFAMISYLLMLNAPAQQLGNLVNLAANASASSQRVFEIVDTPTTIVEQPGAPELHEVRGRGHLRTGEFRLRRRQPRAGRHRLPRRAGANSGAGRPHRVGQVVDCQPASPLLRPDRGRGLHRRRRRAVSDPPQPAPAYRRRAAKPLSFQRHHRRKHRLRGWPTPDETRHRRGRRRPPMPTSSSCASRKAMRLAWASAASP